MPNPPKPAEMKIAQGNPGKRALNVSDALAPLEYGRIDAPDDLLEDGREFWDSIFGAGELWISVRTDTKLVYQVCKQIDRRRQLEELFWVDPADRKVNMSLLETERAIQSGLSLLGFSPADRTRLGLVSAKTKSKLQELLADKAAGV